MKMISKYLPVSLVVIMLCALMACDFKGKTTVEIINPVRHYYPLLRGQELELVYKITNTGNHPLVISDIQTSCGCLIVDKSSFNWIPANKSGFIRLKYNSSKNIGYVKQYITMYANLENDTKTEMNFDLNVVPNSANTKDYEELYRSFKNERQNVEKWVDGAENEKGYWSSNQ